MDDPRQEVFGYVCRRCLKCCHHKRIQVNPYEVARLARNRGVGAAEFRARWTHEGRGVALGQTDDGACVFLGPEGCTVHADRPLVCRLYPLGRHVDTEGGERFSHVTPHPQSEGEYTRDGVIADFLERQGAGPFMQAADEYLAWMMRALAAIPEAVDFVGPDVDAPDPAPSYDLLDMDAAVEDYCSAQGVAPPDDIEARKALHLAILDQSLQGQEEDPDHAHER
jgi:Fe-S-cluster containining protein